MTYRKFATLAHWLFGSLFLGMLPWLVNFLVLAIANQIGFYSIFRVNDLMFFVIVLSATTMMDLSMTKNLMANSPRVFAWMLLLVSILTASIFLGISSFYMAIPPTTGPFEPIQSRLVTGSLVLCGITLCAALWVQFRIRLTGGK